MDTIKLLPMTQNKTRPSNSNNVRLSITDNRYYWEIRGQPIAKQHVEQLLMGEGSSIFVLTKALVKQIIMI